MLTNKLNQMFVSFYYRDIPVIEFEQWIYNELDLEKEIGEALYLELISLNYKDQDDLEKARKHVKSLHEIINGKPISRTKAFYTIQAMLKGDVSLKDCCRTLADLNIDGDNFIPEIFVGYSDEIERLGKDSFYRDRIILDAKGLLAKL